MSFLPSAQRVSQSRYRLKKSVKLSNLLLFFHAQTDKISSKNKSYQACSILAAIYGKAHGFRQQSKKRFLLTAIQ